MDGMGEMVIYSFVFIQMIDVVMSFMSVDGDSQRQQVK